MIPTAHHVPFSRIVARRTPAEPDENRIGSSI